MCIYQRLYRVHILEYNSCVDVHLQYSYRNQVVFHWWTMLSSLWRYVSSVSCQEVILSHLKIFVSPFKVVEEWWGGKKKRRGRRRTGMNFHFSDGSEHVFVFLLLIFGFSFCKLPVQVFASLFGGGCLSFSYWYLLVVENIFYFVANLVTFFMVFLRNSII